MRYRIDKKHLHDDGCEGWWYLTGQKVRRAEDGTRRGRSSSWLVAECNKAGFSECEASAVISEEDVLSVLEGEGR
jgi:hypothetical protein